MLNLTYWRGYIFLCVSLFSFYAFAQDDANTPDGLVRMIVNNVMTTVKQDPAMQNGDIKKIQDLVEKKILPYTNFEKTTALAMGADWRKATPEQQAKIIHEFQLLLIRTYSGAIAQIRDQQVQFGRVRLDGDKAFVPTTVLQNGDKLQMHYRLEKINDQWKVYDMNVLGVWLVEVYKTQFKEQVTKGGIDGLIDFLKERNQQVARSKG